MCGLMYKHIGFPLDVHQVTTAALHNYLSIVIVSLTGPKLKDFLMLCLPKHDLSYTCLSKDKAEFCEMCRNLPYPTHFLHA